MKNHMYQPVRKLSGRRSFLWLLAFVLSTFFCRTVEAAPPGSGWRLTHADEFSDSSVDEVKWDTRYQWGRTHNHDAYMEDANVTLEDGILNLDATRESINGKPFSSGMISSHNTFRYTEGYAEMRIKMPSKQGSWPAFWMLNTGWPPEIDIMEYPLFTDNNIQDRYYANSHWGTAGNPSSNGSWIDRNIDLGNGFHTYGLEWNSSQLKYYFDGQLVKTASNQSSFQNMYLIFNYAVGGWPGAPSQAQWADGETDTTKADWVRVWKKPTSVPDTTWTYQGSASEWWGGNSNWSNSQPAYDRQRAYFSTLSTQDDMLVKWGDSKTVGEMRISGDTSYTFGEAGGSVENIMFADNADGWSRFWVDGGTGNHVVNSRLDAWSHLSIRNLGDNPLTINGDIVGQARGALDGGRLLVRGGGHVILNGDGRYQRKTEVTEGSLFQVKGKLYQGRVEGDAKISLESGGTLMVDVLNDAGTGSLGTLPRGNEQMVLNDGTLVIRDHADTRRGFTIGALGATIQADSRDEVRFRRSALSGQNVSSDSGGALTLIGNSIGHLEHSIPGTGTLIKQGSGSWSLGGVSTYSGGTQVLAGKLVVEGTSGSGLHSISAGATLAGQGTISGQVMNQGILSPGRPQELGQVFAKQGDVDTGTVTAIEFDFAGVQDDAPLIQTSTLHSNLQIKSGLDFGPGIGPRDVDNAGDEFNVQGFTVGGTLASAITAEDYLAFAVQPISGVAMTLNTVDVNLWRNGSNAASNYAILTNLDGFNSGAELGLLSVSNSGSSNQHLFSANYSGNARLIDEELEVRIYGWGANSSDGNTHFNAVSMTAAFESVTNVALDPTGILTLNGNYTQLSDGQIAIDLGGADNSDPFDSQYDSLHVNGVAELEGLLQVSLFNEDNGIFNPALGQSFEILSATEGVVGQFSDANLPELAPDLAWHIAYHTNAIDLMVISSADFDVDGDVDSDDFAMLQGNYGMAARASHGQGDSDGDRDVDGFDFLAWQRQHGMLASLGSASSLTVPEPNATLLVLVAIGLAIASDQRPFLASGRLLLP